MLDPSNLQEKEKNAINAYLIVIQVGAIFAVALLYCRRIIAILMGFLGLDPGGKKLGINILLAFAPAVALGPLLDESMTLLFGAIPVSLALILGALLMHWAEKRKKISGRFKWGRGQKLEDLGLEKCSNDWIAAMRGNVSRYQPIYDDNCGRIFCRIVQAKCCRV